MPVYRKPHEKNFTVIDNRYMLDRGLSLKAKGLLTLMLVLPGDWKFSREGLEAICIEGHVSVADALRELKQNGYLQVRRIRNRGAGGKPFSFDYDIFEDPELCLVGFNTDGNNTDGNNTDGINTDGNPPAYKIRNNQELNNKILNDKEHSHQIRGAGGGSDEDDLNGEYGTGGTWRPKASATDRPDSQCSGGVHASAVPDAIPCRTERGAEYGAATDERSSQCSGALWAPRPSVQQEERIATPPSEARNDEQECEARGTWRPKASATVSPTSHGSSQTLSANGRRPPTTDQRPSTDASDYALRQGIALSENNLKELEDFADKLGDEAVVWAVDEALAGGKKFYAYVRGILSKRVARGAKNMDDIRQMEERRHNGTDQCFGREGPGDAPGRFDCDITV